MLDVSFSISPDDLVSRRRSDPARSTKLIFPWRMCPKSGSCIEKSHQSKGHVWELQAGVPQRLALLSERGLVTSLSVVVRFCNTPLCLTETKQTTLLHFLQPGMRKAHASLITTIPITTCVVHCPAAHTLTAIDKLDQPAAAVALTCWFVGLDSTYTVMIEWDREDSRLSSWLPTRRCVMPRLITCRKEEQSKRLQVLHVTLQLHHPQACWAVGLHAQGWPACTQRAVRACMHLNVPAPCTCPAGWAQRPWPAPARGSRAPGPNAPPAARGCCSGSGRAAPRCISRSSWPCVCVNGSIG